MRQVTRVFFMGSEQLGWALDTDLATIRRSLALVPGVSEVASAHEADVIHSVWEYPLLTADPRLLEGKRIVCTFCNDVPRTFELACMMRAHEDVGLWVAMSRRSERDAHSLQLPVTYVPQAIEPGVFMAGPPAAETAGSIRRRYDIPDDAYVVSSFMRDSLGAALHRPKPQKGVEMFVEIVAGLRDDGFPVHVLLAGPRRHWVRGELRARGVPITFVGKESPGDDNGFNILDAATIRDLYHASDLHLVTSRWEGGPRAVLEAAAAGVRVVSTPVGLADDVLDPACIFRDVSEGVALLERSIRDDVLRPTLAGNLERVRENHTPDANASRYARLYADARELPPFHRPAFSGPTAVGAGEQTPAGVLGRLRARWSALRRARLPGAGLRIGIWHQFHKPPYGGGNQFMMALKRGLERLGATVRSNSLSSSIDVHLCNSAWFDAELFDKARRSRRFRMIHRIDGPVGVYRGGDMAEDDRIYALNRRFASATVMQSAWCLRKTIEIGYRPRRPIIVHNAVDGRIFHPPRGSRPGRSGKLRLIATSWSDNPRKGGAFYKELEQALDWDRFEFTFVGRTKERFSRIRHLEPLPSRPLADALRSADIYVTASRNEPCSNALLEALACGLPALYIDDGSHGELVGQGGLPFDDVPGFLRGLEKIAGRYEAFRSCVWVDAMDDIARRYVDACRAVLADEPVGLET